MNETHLTADIWLAFIGLGILAGLIFVVLMRT